jgi:hypothetical protein
MSSANLDTIRLACSENELSRRYLDVLTRWVRIPMSLYADWPVRPNCGHFFGGVYWYGMETGFPMLVLAAVASSPEFDSGKAGYSADELRAAALRALRYLLFTHDTGPADCVRPAQGLTPNEAANTKWGERGKGFFRESQCAWTLSSMILTAALLKDMLTDEELSMLGAVAEDYIARFGRMDPKTGVYDNTQMEENGWTAMALAGSLCMLPGIDDEEDLWHRTRLWMFRTATTPQDAYNTCSPRCFCPVPGEAEDWGDKPVSAWCGRTFTTLPDLTVENHGFVHPSYLGSAVTLANMTANIFGVFGRPVPPQLHWRRADIHGLFKRWSDSLGQPHCPQGMDWPYVRPVWPALMHSFANCHYGDPEAALLERKCLEMMERLSAAYNGAFVSDEAKTHSRSIVDSMVMWEFYDAVAVHCYLCHRINGAGVKPCAESRVEASINGTCHYPAGGIVLHNHPKGIASFSWRNRTMVLPVTRDGIKLIGPAPNSVLGEYKVVGKGHSENNRNVVIRELPDRVSALLIQDLAGDTVRRKVFFCSLPDGRGISYEVAHALEDVEVEQCMLGYLQVINDGCFGPGSTRMIYWSGGSESFRGYLSGSAEDDRTLDLSGDWINIDDRIGFCYAGTGSACYRNKHYHEVFHAVYDELVLGRYPDSRAFKAGEKIAELAVMWLPERDHESTAKEKFEILTAPPDVFAARVDGWLCACNFGLDERNLDGGLLEPMEPRLVKRTK